MRPVQAVGQPEDIASLVSYLASKEAHSSRAMREFNNSCFADWLTGGVLNEIVT
jgi:hypothetical protein